MSALVMAARRYLGVRFVHRGRRADKLDCAGLVIRSYGDCGVTLPAPPPDYGREPESARFMAATVAAVGSAVPGPAQVGDVVTLRTAHHPHHVAIVGDHPDGLSLIHASGEHGRVVEHRLSPEYLARIVTIHRRPV